MFKHIHFVLALMLATPVAMAAAEAEAPGPTNPVSVREAAGLGEGVERQLAPDRSYQTWAQDPGIYEEHQGDRFERRQVLEARAKTIKLQGVVPPIRFASGVVEISDSYTESLREVLAGMRGRRNVRLHFIGHSDDAPLSSALQAIHGDNTGLSRERAATVAEYFMNVLELPPEALSYEGRGEFEPVASNATAAGKRLNRRVEVEVWYDEIEQQLVEKDVLVAQDLHRIKVCRIETVCQLRYKDGHAQRARVKSLVQPLHYSDDSPTVSADFRQAILQTLNDLQVAQGKQNVVIRLVGHTDNRPLSGRDERIYGNHLALSKAQARRVALTLQEALALPSGMVESDGRGSEQPIASNDTGSGRALNRRIEVEFWYDDALKELPDAPQLCPEAAGAEVVTRVYDPPSGPLAPILFAGGRPVVSEGNLARIRQVFGEVQGRANPRLRFVGYTANQRLERRTASVYGDDIGLSTSRARRASAQVKAALELAEQQVEFEGRGFVQAADVVNAGFVESDTSRVEVQVVYDELAALDDADAIDVTRITREVSPANPFALNLMRISVDGKPIDDPNKSSQDVQRCTDVAFNQAEVQLKFDNLALKPRLNVTAWPNAIRYQDDPATEFPDNLVQFKAYTNYPGFISRAEVRLFEAEQSTRDTPLAVVPITLHGVVEWQAEFTSHQAPSRELKYLLRVYNAQGQFDETEPQPLWIVERLTTELAEHDPERELLVGYGENRLALQTIPLQGGTITVHGKDIPPEHTVWVAGDPVLLGAQRDFIAEKILPDGLHTVEVAVIDTAGSGTLFLRDLELKQSDWFYVGIADLTISQNDTSGPAKLVTNDKARYDNDLAVDGRLAGYVRGKFGDNWQLTASADTLEGPVKDLFSNFMDKSPDALFRRIDPDYYYPTFGDDSTVEEGAPTLGKFYLKLQREQDYGLWGNFKVAYVDNTLTHVDRGLYGANVHLQSADTTSFGELRYLIDGFAAQPGTIASRDELRGTGGSLYYLRHQDILVGSERVRVEVRDRDSGLVVGVKPLTAGLDYSIDYLQGRIVLTQPLSGTASDGMLIDSGAGGNNEVYLVARYEFTPGFDKMDNISNGGRAHYWVGDHLRLGVTASHNKEAGDSSNLGGVDLILRKNAQTWLKVEASRSEGEGVDTLFSWDGGYSFDGSQGLIAPNDKANAYRIDTSLGLSDLHDSLKGRATLYTQSVGAGYAAPGLITDRAVEQVGGTLAMPVTDEVEIRVKADRKVQDRGLETAAAEVDAAYAYDEHWTLSAGLRHDSRKDKSPLVPQTQVEGDRTDVIARAAYDTRERWMAYGYLQDTLNSSGNRDKNARVGAGGGYQVSDRFKLLGEASTGDLGEAGRLGAEYLYSDRTTLYSNYGLENERSDNGLRARKGNLASGLRMHYSDTTSVYLEERYAHGDVPTGLTHAAGVDLAPTDRWNIGVNGDFGTLRDHHTGAKLERQAIGVRVGYGFETIKVASALEYRVDTIESVDLSVAKRTTWLFKNSLRYQLNPDWRFLGKLDHSRSESSQGEFYDGRYTEAVAGYAYRPISHDRLNALLKYTYFYNLPSAGQVTGSSATTFVQKSHIFSVDTIYDLSARWSVGGKYAYRLGQVALDRADPEFFDSRAHLYIARVDWRFASRWNALLEGRLLDLPDARDSRSGALVAVYRKLGNHIKLGAGYNFATFSDDLTNLDYDHRGVFINLIGSL